MSTDQPQQQQRALPTDDGEAHLTETKWWDELCEGIFGPRKGGARIIIDAENASTGAGKTGLAVFLARLLCERKFGYELQPEDLTLSGQKYLERWQEHPGAEQPSVIILDEIGGAGAGHARRSMSHQNVELGNAWQLMRKKRIVSIVTLPHWSKVDIELRKQADYRLWCKEKPIGYFRAYDVGSSFDKGTVETDGYDDVDRIRFPNLDAANDPVYNFLSQKKDNLLESDYLDADKVEDTDSEEHQTPDEARKKQKKEIAQRMRDNGWKTTEIAESIGMSQPWVSKHTDPPES